MLDVKIPIQKINIEEDGLHLMINGKVNGKDCNFLVDTGASRTVFDNNQIQEFIKDSEAEIEKNDKLGTGVGSNTMESQVTTLESIEFDSLFIADYEAILLDLKHVNESYQELGFNKIIGVLGSDLMDEYNACISYKESSIRFSVL
ncbi:MAG: aspartyl protease family protein [Bacteroidales bacterium]